MTRFLKRPLIWVLIGVAGLLLAGVFFSMTVAGASLRCVQCDCTYSLLSANETCRWPAVWGLLSEVVVLISLLAFLAAAILRFRSKRV